jgi:hypothetical protein
MTYFRDLSNPVYDRGVKFTNIIMCGWLNPRHNYNKGKSPIPYEIFKDLADRCWCAVSMGHHTCEFCGCDPESYFDGSIYLKVGNILWDLPRMVWHYIKDHDYLIPQELVDIIDNESYELIEREYGIWRNKDLPIEELYHFEYTFQVQLEYLPYLEAVAKWNPARFKNFSDFEDKIHMVWGSFNPGPVVEGNYYVQRLGERWRNGFYGISLYENRDLLPDEISLTKTCLEGENSMSMIEAGRKGFFSFASGYS